METTMEKILRQPGVWLYGMLLSQTVRFLVFRLVVIHFSTSPSRGLLHAAAAEPSSHHRQEDQQHLPTGSSFVRLNVQHKQPRSKSKLFNDQGVWSTVGVCVCFCLLRVMRGSFFSAELTWGNNLIKQKKRENDKKTKESNTTKVWQMCTGLPSLSA